MKKTSILLSLLIVTLFLSPLYSAEKPDANPPIAGFKSLKELEFWANKHEWTGGKAGLLKIKGKSVFYSIRSFTSGRESSEVIFYSLNAKGEIHPFLVIPKQMKGLKVSGSEDEITISEYNFETKKWLELMSFNSLLLPLTSK